MANEDTQTDEERIKVATEAAREATQRATHHTNPMVEALLDRANQQVKEQNEQRNAEENLDGRNNPESGAPNSGEQSTPPQNPGQDHQNSAQNKPKPNDSGQKSATFSQKSQDPGKPSVSLQNQAKNRRNFVENKPRKIEQKKSPEHGKEAETDLVDRIIDKIDEADDILVALPRDPDVDDLASAIGLTLFLDRMGKRATAVFSGKTPKVLDYLHPDATLEPNTDGLRDFIISISKDKADHIHYSIDGDLVRINITPYKTIISHDDLDFAYGEYNVDLVLLLDVPEQGKLDSALKEFKKIREGATVINITTGTAGDVGEFAWADAQASSTAELVAKLIFALEDEEVTMDGNEATAFLTGIIADTDHFANEKTTAEALSLAAELTRRGADQKLIPRDLSGKTGVDRQPDLSDATLDAIAADGKVATSLAKDLAEKALMGQEKNKKASKSLENIQKSSEPAKKAENSARDTKNEANSAKNDEKTDETKEKEMETTENDTKIAGVRPEGTKSDLEATETQEDAKPEAGIGVPPDSENHLMIDHSPASITSEKSSEETPLDTPESENEPKEAESTSVEQTLGDVADELNLSAEDNDDSTFVESEITEPEKQDDATLVEITENPEEADGNNPGIDNPVENAPEKKETSVPDNKPVNGEGQTPPPDPVPEKDVVDIWADEPSLPTPSAQGATSTTPIAPPAVSAVPVTAPATAPRETSAVSPTASVTPDATPATTPTESPPPSPVSPVVVSASATLPLESTSVANTAPQPTPPLMGAVDLNDLPEFDENANIGGTVRITPDEAESPKDYSAMMAEALAEPMVVLPPADTNSASPVTQETPSMAPPATPEGSNAMPSPQLDPVQLAMQQAGVPPSPAVEADTMPTSPVPMSTTPAVSGAPASAFSVSTSPTVTVPTSEPTTTASTPAPTSGPPANAPANPATLATPPAPDAPEANSIPAISYGGPVAQPEPVDLPAPPPPPVDLNSALPTMPAGAPAPPPPTPSQPVSQGAPAPAIAPADPGAFQIPGT